MAAHSNTGYIVIAYMQYILISILIFAILIARHNPLERGAKKSFKRKVIRKMKQLETM